MWGETGMANKSGGPAKIYLSRHVREFPDPRLDQFCHILLKFRLLAVVESLIAPRSLRARANKGSVVPTDWLEPEEIWEIPSQLRLSDWLNNLCKKRYSLSQPGFIPARPDNLFVAKKPRNMH